MGHVLNFQITGPATKSLSAKPDERNGTCRWRSTVHNFLPTAIRWKRYNCDKGGERKGKLQKEYSVASENEETYDNEKQALRNLKEYSVVSESDDFEVKDKKKSISVISLEKKKK